MARRRNGAIAWMAANPVAANLLMVALIGIGFYASTQTKQEVFPTFTPAQVSVTFAYPGASPEEVEQGIILAVEEATRGLDDVKRVESTAQEGRASINVIMMESADLERALSDVKAAIDRLRSLPQDAERPVVRLIKPKQRTISIALHGEGLAHSTLRQQAELLRAGLINQTEITQAELNGTPSREIAIEIKPEILRTYGLTIDQVARKIRSASVELPSGRIRASSGEILLRTTERRNLGSEFADIVILAQPDGTRLKLGDVAKINDGFSEVDQEKTFNGNPTVTIDVYRVGDQTPTGISDQVKTFLDDYALPPGLEADLMNDRSVMFQDRIDLLLRNAFSGLILVFVVLGIFLEMRLAFWVMLGIPISFLGAFVLLPGLDASINMVSMFAFILVLGIVVDDAIVVGENIFQKKREGMSGFEAAVDGAKEVGTPVVFAVLTTMVAFGPLLLVPGFIGEIFGVIPLVVIATLLLSLVESLFILPAHLAHSGKKNTGIIAAISRATSRFSRALESFVQRVYIPVARAAATYRYVTLAIALASIMITVGYVRGVMSFNFLPKIESDLVVASVRLPVDSTFEHSQDIRDRLVQGAQKAIDKHGGMGYVKGINAAAGQAIGGFGPRSRSASGTNVAEVAVQLVPLGDRDFSGKEFTETWRTEVGELLGIENSKFSYAIGRGGGSPVDVRLSHPDIETLENAARQLAEKLRSIEGVEDIDPGFSNGKSQLDARLTHLGRAAGLTETDLARQLRSFFYGAEVLRQQRGRDEVKVIVRLPRTERDRVSSLESLILKTPTGKEIPLSLAATLTDGRAYSTIRRVDGQRVVSVTADITEGKTTADKVMGALRRDMLPELTASTPGLTFTFQGQSEERRESFSSMGKNSIIALLIIFGLLAIPFRSYIQPALVMSAIPFGIVGAVAGHVLMGFNLSVISVMGFIALSGVVVNDSLIMIVATNQFRREGASPMDAVVWGGARRFRPILLTSLTTFFGLLPMMFESSVQARFLIPMALSLGFGVLWVTVIVLLFLPAFYMILEDLKNGLFVTEIDQEDDSKIDSLEVPAA